jgi:hypothetical protein
MSAASSSAPDSVQRARATPSVEQASSKVPYASVRALSLGTRPPYHS